MYYIQIHILHLSNIWPAFPLRIIAGTQLLSVYRGSIGLMIAGAAGDGFLVELAKTEPEERRGRIQSAMMMVTRRCTGAHKIFLRSHLRRPSEA